MGINPLPSVRRAIDAYIEQAVEPHEGLLLRVTGALALLAGAIQAWAHRHANNPGGISYLDIADAYMRGDVANAVNGYWSPLYSVLLGPALMILRPGPYYEAAVAHLVNFLIYCGALVTFGLFLRAVMDYAGTPTGSSIPRWVWITFGYATFAWSSLILIGLGDLSADLLMAAFVYGAAAVLVRMQTRPVSLAAGAALGLMLGLGYLSKAAMFPLAFVFFAVALASRSAWRRNVPAVAVGVLVFAIVAAPFVVALSRQKGRLTTGDVGKLVYAWFVNGVPKYAHWQGEAPGRGVPAHPDRKIHDDPEVFEYATPVSGTHPVWYDPSYWYEGLQTHVDSRRQIRALVTAARLYWQLVLDAAAPLLAIALLLSLESRGDIRRRIARQSFLLVPALVPFAMFAILHTETRFLGAFVVMALLALLLAVRLPATVEGRRIVASSMVIATMVIGLAVAVRAAQDALLRGPRAQNIDYDIATGLQAMGLQPGAQVGTIGWAYDSYWARLARVRIIAEMPQPDATEFWSDMPERQQSALEAFRRAGVSVLVAAGVPRRFTAEGWRQVGATGYYAYFLDSPAPR